MTENRTKNRMPTNRSTEPRAESMTRIELYRPRTTCIPALDHFGKLYHSQHQTIQLTWNIVNRDIQFESCRCEAYYISCSQSFSSFMIHVVGFSWVPTEKKVPDLCLFVCCCCVRLTRLDVLHAEWTRNMNNWRIVLRRPVGVHIPTIRPLVPLTWSTIWAQVLGSTVNWNHLQTQFTQTTGNITDRNCTNAFQSQGTSKTMLPQLKQTLPDLDRRIGNALLINTAQLAALLPWTRNFSPAIRVPTVKRSTKTITIIIYLFDQTW